MNILGIDFSTSQRSVALVQCEDGASAVLAALSESGTRETHAFRMIATALHKAKIDRRSVDAIAMGLGPGSYGGIRVALSIAQGWQLATAVKTAGVDSAIAIAEPIRVAGHRGPLHVIIDAQRGEFYRASYELSDEKSIQTSTLEIITRSQLEESMGSGERHVGPDLETRIGGVETAFPDAATIANYAGSGALFVGANQLSPIYIRPVEFVKAPTPRADL